MLLLLVFLHINAMFRVVITPPPLPLHIVNIFQTVITLAQHLFSGRPSQWRSEAELKGFHVEKTNLEEKLELADTICVYTTNNNIEHLV